MDKNSLRSVLRITVGITILASLLLSVEVVMVVAGLPDFQRPGKLAAIGTHFELNNSEYLNITLDSTEPIKLVLESSPKMVSMDVESLSGATSTNITLSGFTPLTMYHKYEDDYHNHVVFTTDSSGKYTYMQEISKAHFIFIQPDISTTPSPRTFISRSISSLAGPKFITDDATGGDCELIGIWDLGTRTCTLTTDLTDTIQIDNDEITLDGSGHTIIGTYTGYGIFSRRSRVTIKNLTITQFSGGMRMDMPNNNILNRNNVSYNGAVGILLQGGSNNILSDNIVLRNYYGINIEYSSDCMLNGNIAKNNQYGITIQSGQNNILSANNASNNNIGIHLWSSSYNTLSGNIASSNGFIGIEVEASNKNILSSNIVDSNYVGIGFSWYENNDNKINGNIITNNERGIRCCEVWSNNNYIYESKNNIIYNNYFKNANNLGAMGTSHILNIIKTAGTNIVGGPYIGGNFWGQPDGNGYSQKCIDSEPDGICDLPNEINSNNIDYLPIAQIRELNAEAGGPYSGAVNNPVVFTSSVSGGISPYLYSWNFGDGITDSQQHTNHPYSRGGIYIATLTVIDSQGRTTYGTAQVAVVSPLILATVDVKPDTLNKARKGDAVTAYIFIEIPGYNVNNIDVSTVKLRTNKGMVSAMLSPTEVGDHNSNGIPDLMVKFDRQAVIGIVDIGDVLVTISGKISGEDFEGGDEITVIDSSEQIPEFPTVAIPIISIIGFMFMFQRRKGK